MSVVSINVHKAQPIGKHLAPDLYISADVSISYDNSKSDKQILATNMALFQREAKRLSDALFATLPGGTIDALLREMLLRKASQLVVKF